MLKAIWCQTPSGGIGKDNYLPWKLPAEIRTFKAKTVEGVIIMGYNTWLSIGQEPLPLRTHIIYAPGKRFTEDTPEGVHIINNVPAILHMASTLPQDVWVIGGARTFKDFKPYITEYHVSITDREYDCDTYVDMLTDNLRLIMTTPNDGFTHYVYEVLND